MKILTVVGARPQFIKAAVLSRTISNTKGVEEVIVHTGQHYDKNMSNVFFDEMQIPKPIYNLAINNQSKNDVIDQMKIAIEDVIRIENPDCVLVYGDTNSTLAGGLAANNLKIPLVHVEAGLRSFNLEMPEEYNRIETDKLSQFLFCPTKIAVDNLNKEGVRDNQNVELVGDIMLESAIFYNKLSNKSSSIIDDLKLQKEEFVLVTIHRQGNTDNIENLKNIISSLNTINLTHKIICPIHPRTKKIIEINNINIEFLLIDPIGYFDMIQLIKNSLMVLTDSGGLQKEAYFFKKKCLTLREETEWVELVESGSNILVGSNTNKILKNFTFLKNKNIEFDSNYFGNGDTSKLILNSLIKTILKN